MDEFANLTTNEKQPYFEKAAASKGLSPIMIEKDFWICWVLKKLFSQKELSSELLFKGGTSLSKVYNLIERFSEDLDITINRAYLGFDGDSSPENAPSNKKKEAILKKLSIASQDFVHNKLKNILGYIIETNLTNIVCECSIEIDANDPSKQTLLFYYPTESNLKLDTYINPYVKIEFGARGGDWPILQKEIKPMVEEEIPQSIYDANIQINVLDANRTFWEKALILHKYSHFPEDKTIPERQSRHYFDFYKMLTSGLCAEAEKDFHLLKKVVEHNKIYFRTGWANYDSAKKGMLNLTSNKYILRDMSDDYKKMASMFYGDKIEWDEIISGIRRFESTFNADFC